MTTPEILVATGLDPEPPLATSTTQAMPIASLVITVFGQPKSKGSLRHVGGGRMVEQVAGSKDWRVAVKEATRAAMAARPSIAALAPLVGPLSVEATITVAKPRSAPKRRETWPITRSSGDVDKHARNLLDALVDAGLLGDDSQVIDCIVRKRYPGQHPDTLTTPGAVIRVTSLGGPGDSV